MTYRYAVIIPHYNDTARLRRCLEVLSAGDLADVELLVVDNGSTEPMEGIKADFPRVRYTYEARKGAALARNRGVVESTAPHLFFIDADCVPAKDWLSVAKSVAGSADLIGGRIDVFDETAPPRSGAEAFETVFAFNYRDYILRKHFSVTANLLTRRDVFLDVGPFVDGVSEDQEWCLRARSKGYGIVCEERLMVSHPTRSNWPALKKKSHRLTREMFVLNGTSGPARAKWAMRAVAMPLSGLAHMPRILGSAKLNGTTERVRGAVTLFRIRALRGYWMVRQALGLSI